MGQGEAINRLLAALSTVIAGLGRPSVLVGGVAVAARLGRVERVTGDIDAVIDAPDEPPSADLLLQSGTAQERLSRSSVVVQGVRVDLIDTFAVPEEIFVGTSGANELFAAAHRFGFDTATALRLVVHRGREVETIVAEPAGLIAMKLHAARWRRDRTKLPSDLFDIFRLLTEFDREGELEGELVCRPGLGQLCLEAAETIFVEQLTANAGAVSRSGDAVIASVTRDDLADVGQMFVRRLRRLLE
jgi:hypothetical protein